MKELLLEEEAIRVTFKGESHQMRLPSNKDIMDLRKNTDTASETVESMDVMHDFFQKLGLPREFTLNLTPKHSVKIMESIVDVKN